MQILKLTIRKKGGLTLNDEINEIKKIKINNLPRSSVINDEDVFIKNDQNETSKIAAGSIAEYVTRKVPVYTHPDSGITPGIYRSVTVDEQGHVTAGANPATLAEYGITDALPASAVHDWAKAETKPVYTADETGADEAGSANAAYEKAKTYTNTKIAELINGAPTTLDTLGEIAEAMSDNQDVVEALNAAIGTKAGQAELDGHTGNTAIHITAAEKSKLSGIETGAQKNTVTGIKGNAESSYRTGNVNITPANIGLEHVNNTADENKRVSYATSAGNADAVDWVHFHPGDGSGAPNGFGYVYGFAGGGDYHAYVWPTNKMSVNYASSAGNADTVDGYHASSFASSSHSHSYLPLSGGTVTGAVNLANNTWNKVGDDVMIGDCNVSGQLGIKTANSGADTGIYMYGKDYGAATAMKMGSDSRTLFLYGSSYLNLCSPGIQCRTYDDKQWAGISFSSYTTQNNSSRKLKDHIKNITDERARQILDVNVVTFDYKEGVVTEDHRYDRTGVIAEDTENVCPEVINYDEGEASGVQYDRFIPYLIRMVQLQQEEIDRLKAHIQ